MPGIVGKAGGSLETLPREIGNMVQSMLHEPFYRSGAYASDRQPVGLGAVFHENSFAAGQPFWNAGRNVCLVFSGECFGLEELILKERTNASALLSLYEKDTDSFVERLNGVFSGALVDFRTNQVFLFNDRYGLGRIYYYETGAAFYFASEAKALLAIRPELRRLDEAGLAEQFSCGCTIQGRTLFSGISLLPPASLWRISFDGEVQRSSYFGSTSWETQEVFDKPTYDKALEETFARVLPRYFRDSESLGMSLTGGLDGRMIMACVPPSAGRFPCYTFGGPYRDCADVSIGRQVARACGHSHEVLPIDDTFSRDFPRLAEKSVYVSDGTMDVGGAVEIYANRLARAVAPIRLTGNYGSEILRRNIAFRPVKDSLPFLAGDFADLLSEAALTYEQERAVDSLSFVAFKQVPWHHYGRLSIEQSQLTVRSPYLDNDLVALAYRAPENQRKSAGPALRVIAKGNPALARIPTDRGLLLNPRPALTKMLRAWREGTVRAEYAYDYGMPQWLAKIDGALRPMHFERLFLGRHKFYHFRVWYRDQLAQFVREILLDRRSLARPYLRPAVVERLVQEHLSGRGNHTLAIHKLLTAEFIHRQLIDGTATVSRSDILTAAELVSC